MVNQQKSSVKIFTPTVHALFDYVLVILLFILPSVVSGVTTTFAVVLYTLGGLQLLNALSTDFDGGLFATISLRTHAVIEILAAVALVVSPWVIGFVGVARNTVIALGVFVFVVWMLTDFSQKNTQEESTAQKETADENAADSDGQKESNFEQSE
jgi:hypothetical protein